MTCRELYLLARRRLGGAGVDSPGADAAALAQRFLGLDRAGLALHGEEAPPPQREAAFLQAVEERAARRPLQYILGEWEFMGLPLAVGEGVLCPREDTAVLVEELARRLGERPRPRGLDLCAGTGAVALGLRTLLPQAEVLCLELSDRAFPYLEENLRRHGKGLAAARKGDVLSPALAGEFTPGSLDFIASNPPYIETGELPGLQPEVRQEPALALDGGADGLVFYRAIARLWAPLVKPGGLVAVEIGESQGPAVERLFQQAGLTAVETAQDWAGLDRVVSGLR
ncbi:peptide chain release factor N(5)-glutamine methyltransferase [Acutalibacter sp. LFL-21]|uniref:peptide chain release factor N(5)-glutamine methyltransferase n=1 Tax=Acutalibacter sp. LFL-21 TaxID=2983399 RepID=UPI0021D65939|nr:peptide chain release factor N(5)-glutamine methyltransferase [Acutalibacter sp. LFL-21]MCU7653340.1 peptide chain release factor N(5)-glutamine methyltransferase [Acutalibacter sp. LFL-21]